MFNFYLNKASIILLMENGKLKPSYVLAKCRAAEQKSRSRIEHYRALLHTRADNLNEQEKVVLKDAIDSETSKLDENWAFANEILARYPGQAEVSLASILKRFS